MNLDDIAVIEGNSITNERSYYETVQRAINGGEAWKFQGSIGRTLMGAIEAGYCLLGQCASVDFYGSTIPSRSEVAAGSKGSREFVVAHRGEAWAILMEAVGAE
jgi:hypothetical protein